MTNSNDLTALIAELARAQARTEAAIQQTQETIRVTQISTAESQNRTDASIRETQEIIRGAQIKTEASIQETQLNLQETHHQVIDLKSSTDSVLNYSRFIGGRNTEEIERHEQRLILNEESVYLLRQLLITQERNFTEHQRESREIQRSIEAGLTRLEAILVRRLDNGGTQNNG
ncbi:MAG: hypothetical protein H0X31_02755 [Nostocaceae cyanobacterium]|nr:hypothetical protein [Nostocaceae cyanobacterium]